MSLRVDTPSVGISPIRWELVALASFFVVQMSLAIGLPVAGPFSVDEVIYGEMARSLTEGFGFFIDNGYEEVASPELATMLMRITEDGHLTGQYPYGLPLMAAPAYALLGVRGIMVLNAIALVAVVALTYTIAKTLLGDRWIAGISALVLLAATYIWEYSVAIWPHLLALALSLGAVVTMLVAADGPARRTAKYGALSGLLFGLAVLARLDTVILLPVVALCLYQRRPQWPRAAGAFVVGAIPAAGVMSWSNYVRWGTPLPFSYGGSITGWLLPLIATGLGLIILGLTIAYALPKLPSRATKTAIAVTAGVLVVVIPTTRRLVSETLQGIWTLVVDLRQYPQREGPGLERLPDGTLLYAKTAKKSLLQSLPYLAIIAIPIATAWRTAQRRTILILTTPIVLYIGFYAPRAWHGGLSFNLRYFIPLLPFAAVLTAWALHAILDRGGLDFDRGRIVRMVAIITLALFATGRVLMSSVEASAWFFSVPPLAIAAGTLIAVMALIWRPRPTTARLLFALSIAGLIWAGATAYGYDAAATLNIRHSHAHTSAAIAELIEDDSLLLVDWPDNTFGVKEHREKVVIALPSNDDYATLDTLLTHFGQTRSVYGAMTPMRWEAITETSPGDWVDVGQVGNYWIRRMDGTPTTQHPLPLAHARLTG